MASRITRNTVILLKVETTYGTDAMPTGAANALLVSNASINLAIDSVNRDLIRSTLGGSEQLVGTRHLEITFDVELSGSGTAGTAPAWGPVLRACGMAETITAGVMAEYTPVSTGFESATVYYYLDGVLHKALGCRGTVEPKATLGERPMLSVKLLGLYGGVVANANPSTTLTAWRQPVAITDATCGDVLLGCTYTGASGTLTGGTAFPSRGATFTLGQDAKFIPLLGGESVDITSREATGQISLALDAAQSVTAFSDIVANTIGSLGLTIGTVAGATVVLFAPAVQRVAPKWDDYEGRALLSTDLRLLPLAGNDELRIVAR